MVSASQIARTQSSNGRSVYLSILLVALLSGCRSGSRWEPVVRDTPWIDAGVQATQREHSYACYMAASDTTDVYWGTETRRGMKRGRVRRQFESYIQKSGWLAEWDKSKSTINGTTQRLAPYRFTVVSVRPTVIIATPLDISNAAQYGEIHRLIDRPPLQRIDTDYLITPLEYGTTVPATDALTFINLNSGERQDISIPSPERGVQYVTKGCGLTLERMGAVWRITRRSVR